MVVPESLIFSSTSTSISRSSYSLYISNPCGNFLPSRSPHFTSWTLFSLPQRRRRRPKSYFTSYTQFSLTDSTSSPTFTVLAATGTTNKPTKLPSRGGRREKSDVELDPISVLNERILRDQSRRQREDGSSKSLLDADEAERYIQLVRKQQQRGLDRLKKSRGDQSGGDGSSFSYKVDPYTLHAGDYVVHKKMEWPSSLLSKLAVFSIAIISNQCLDVTEAKITSICIMGKSKEVKTITSKSVPGYIQIRWINMSSFNRKIYSTK